jgi:hypothetical protein
MTMSTAVRNIQCYIPFGDFAFFERIAKGMGWSFSTISPAIARKAESATEISDEEAMAFIRQLHAEGGSPIPADESSVVPK